MSVRSDPFEAGYDDGDGLKKTKIGISAAASSVWLPGAKVRPFARKCPRAVTFWNDFRQFRNYAQMTYPAKAC
jgi:hypothetical protein